jgi:Tol biopolymer transport system component
MSAIRPLETRLPDALEELSAPRTPAYFDDILGQVARTRQRPGWTFLERWLPMTAVTDRLATAPRVSLRLAVAIALLIGTLAIGLALVVGSQRPPVPAPFGIAGNGEVAFTNGDGAILVGNPVDGTSTVLVGGNGHERPVFSPDGTRLASLQTTNDEHTPNLIVSDADGQDPIVVATDGMADITYLGWSPDSRRIVVITSDGKLLAFDTVSGAQPATLLDGIGVGDGYNIDLADLFRPPAGDEVLVAYDGPGGYGLYRRPLDGGAPIAVLTSAMTTVPCTRTNPPPCAFGRVENPSWSPDGSRIVFGLVPKGEELGRAWIINADGTDLRQLTNIELPTPAMVSEAHMAWSPDGTRVAIQRWFNDPATGDAGPRAITIADVATGDEREIGPVNVNGYVSWGWSPDGSSIIEVPNPPSVDAGTVIIIDVETGDVTRHGWDAGSAATWQRTPPRP